MARIPVPAYEWTGETTTQRGQRPDRKIRKVRKWAAAAPSSGPTAPSLSLGTALTFVNASDGVVLSGADITDWLALEGADWTQAGSSDRCALSTTTFSGDRESVDTDGSTDHMYSTDSTLIAALDGTKSYTRYGLIVVPTVADNEIIYAFSRTDSSTRYDFVRWRDLATDDWSFWRRGSASTSVVGTPSGAVDGVEISLVEAYNAATSELTVWLQGTKVLDAVTHTEANITPVHAVSFGGWLQSLFIGACGMGIREHGYWSGVANDADAAVLDARRGT